jgi:hypothetical protein
VPDGVPDGAGRGAQRGPDGVPDGMARRGGQTECPTGPDGVPNGAGWVARRCGQMGCPTGGQTGWLDGVPRWGARRGQTGATLSATSFFECHVIGHIIF